MRHSDSNHCVKISVTELFDPAAFKENVKLIEITMKRSLKCVETAAAAAVEEFIERNDFEFFRRVLAEKTQFLTSKNLALREFDTE